MQQPIEFEAPDELSGWGSAWRVLALERCMPVWQELGVPPTMIAQPAALLDIARAYHRAIAHGLPAPPDAADTDDVMQLMPSLMRSLLTKVFAAVVTEYGAIAADQLYRWARRLFVQREL